MYVDSGRVEAAAEIRNFLELDDQILMNSIINATHLVNMADFSSATTRDKATLLAVFEKIMDNSKDSVSAYMLSLNTQKAIIQSGAQDGDSFDKYLDRSGIEFTKSIQSDIDAAGQLMSLTVEPTEAIEGLTVDQRLEFARKLRNIGAVDAAMSLNRR
jgi:HSP90 family molecular chaperone